MRYPNPSIESAVKRLSQRGVEELLVIPLYPHYAMSSFETAAERVKEVVRRFPKPMQVEIVPPYYDKPDYIEALAASASGYLLQGYDHLLFSFHGLPERHLRKADSTKKHCLVAKNCCGNDGPAHATCYRAQCFKTVRTFARKAGLSERHYSVAFQSRLNRGPWMQPYTDEEIVRLAKRGVKRLLVICPAFVSDCLETLEEIGMRGKEVFQCSRTLAETS